MGCSCSCGGTGQLAAACSALLNMCSVRCMRTSCTSCGGLQVHLGYFATEVAAARAHDLATLTKAGKQGANAATHLSPASFRYSYGSILPGKLVAHCRLMDMLIASASWGGLPSCHSQWQH